MGELLRVVAVVGAALWLVHPYFAPRLIGTGDALWNHHLLADTVTQFRAGVFPVFVGQSEFSFNGAIYPIRAAPYYQYFGGLIDLLTGRSLGFFALQHLTVIASFVGGALSAYAALAWLAPTRRWAAAVLALLYVMCPGVAGLLYAQDLYMSCMTVPWVPLAFAAMVRSFDDDSSAPVALLAASLAALWWAHSPIALWATLIAAFTQVAWVALKRLDRRAMSRAFMGAAIFGALAAYPIVSVFLLRTPGETIVPYLMDREALLTEIRNSFPSSIQPINLHAPLLTGLQLGYALWLVLVASGVAWCFTSRSWVVGLLLCIAGFLLVLVFPVPEITRILWFHFPETLVGMTLYWPMQRLYILVAGAAVVCAQRLIAELPPKKLAASAAILGGLILSAIWSASEASKFLHRALLQVDTVEDSRRWSLPENVAIQRHTYGLFSQRPAYFNHGVVDPRMESRLLDPATSRVIASDYDPAPRQPGPMEFKGTIDANPGVLNLDPPLVLQPDEEYLLTFQFARPDTTGVLQISGPDFYREYGLPESGGPKAFGSTALAGKSIILWTSGSKSETVRLRFIPTGNHAKASDYNPFASYRLRRIDQPTLPVRVGSLMPYRAMVRSPRAAILESPRMFVPGYAAKVNGNDVPVRKSSEGLVAFPVPAGESRVELRFAGLPALHAAFWLSIIGWLLAVVWAGVRLIFKDPQGRPAQ